jgi:two-component system LytT family sensor kinase
MTHAVNGSLPYVLVILLIKLGVIASLASIIARFDKFRRLLLTEVRTTREKLLFAAFLGVPFLLGVLARLLPTHYQGTDLSLEITVVGGLLGGTMVGLMVGTMVSLPAVLIGHEILALPMAVLYAVVAGSARWICPHKEEIWKFSPFIDKSLYRSIRQRFKQPAMDWQVLFFLLCIFLEMSRIAVGRLVQKHHWLFYVQPANNWAELLIMMSTAIAVALPLRIWNSTRIERKLEEKERLLIQARVDALISQINPHFLFNTLNTISSLIRFDPDRARELLLKLSNILRRRLRTQTHFVTLRQELEFMDDYLDIEVARFGRDKLQILKEIDPATLDAIVPSMILQPVVENAIRHGIGSKIEGGTITFHSAHTEGRIVIEVSDNGVGMPLAQNKEVPESGIGMVNVRERLKALYGQEFAMKVDSRPGQGTTIRFEFPELFPADEAKLSEAVASQP